MPDSHADKSLFSLSQIQHLMRVEFSRAQRYGYPIGCLVVAIDRLGHLRDMYGFEAKEELVGGIVDLLRDGTRASDFLGRTADDRLLAVVPHTDETGLERMSQRLLAGARELPFASDGRTIQVTLSIGGSWDGGFDGRDRTLFFDAMLRSAEAALAEATSAGGDRHVLIPPGAAG